MHGWKTVERAIPGPVLIDQAVARATNLGFTVHARQPGHVVLHRAGTQLTVRGDRFPLELTIAEAEDGLFLRLRYNTFVLFDTGDLERVADDLASAMTSAAT
ncbi:hypothetical protein QCN29_21000 [Streptomyces sp. HNM0663]|uniref:Uncharacterized protein n=1 Tax=Streptomyces chengmaiensis TaxID=3040919 RepID=A0ABT6HSA6_9ACTN|nr:hypothetical protein [Streptomyces chengmaiensis]MDH2391216.1 hypothetical protein [Streptomyces chengmaiensis]